MFRDGYIESQGNSVQIFGLNSELMNLLLQYIYTGHISFTENTAKELIHGAEFLRITALRDEACNYLKMVLCPGNSAGLYSMAQNYGYLDLESSALNYIMK